MLVRDKFPVSKAELGKVLLLVPRKPLLGWGPLQVCRKYKEACKAAPLPIAVGGSLGHGDKGDFPICQRGVHTGGDRGGHCLAA